MITQCSTRMADNNFEVKFDINSPDLGFLDTDTTSSKSGATNFDMGFSAGIYKI